jgi:NUDIX domain
MTDAGHPERDWTKPYRLAAGFYAKRGAHMLMLERAAGMMIGFWGVPGGSVDPGETPQEAAARELFEETGLRPTSPLWLTLILAAGVVALEDGVQCCHPMPRSLTGERPGRSISRSRSMLGRARRRSASGVGQTALPVHLVRRSKSASAAVMTRPPPAATPPRLGDGATWRASGAQSAGHWKAKEARAPQQRPHRSRDTCG